MMAKVIDLHGLGHASQKITKLTQHLEIQLAQEKQRHGGTNILKVCHPHQHGKLVKRD